MTQVDLPQVSVQRYLELLRRRRWQVIPVSLLGLVIGGLVAFFIPRYYVAQSVLTYESPPGASVARGDEDPFLVIVDTARLTLPNAIESAVKTLGWEQAAIADPFERTQALRQLEGRLEVGDANPGKGRKHARIVVTYRDRDGLRSADFVNTLVGTWMQQRLADLRAGAEQDKATATARYNELQAAYNQYLDRRSTLERTYGIDPALDLGWQKVAFDRREADLQQRRAELAALRKAIVAAQQRLAQLQERRNLLPARVQVGTELSLEELAKLPAAQKLLLELDYYQKLVEAYRPGNPWRRAAEGRVAEIKLDLAKVASGQDVAADGTVPNPECAAILQTIEATELELRTNEALAAPLQQQVEGEGSQLARQSEGYREYASLAQAIRETEKGLDAARGDVELANATLGRLSNQAPVKVLQKASPPTRPTEPNILLVALIGCVLGLGVAIALILLIDVLQGSFKTVDDVERGLTVPVLGGMSHLETLEERQGALRSRRRITLVTASFVALVGGVVALFYWDPTRLPVFVRDLLQVVLGTT